MELFGLLSRRRTVVTGNANNGSSVLSRAACECLACEWHDRENGSDPHLTRVPICILERRIPGMHTQPFIFFLLQENGFRTGIIIVRVLVKPFCVLPVMLGLDPKCVCPIF